MLFLNVQLVSPGHPLHRKLVHLKVKQGLIASIGEEQPVPEGPFLDMQQSCVSVGWMDMQAALMEPGFEHKDDTAHLRKAAAYGGFTDLLVQPNTKPILQYKEGIRTVTEGNARELVRLHPMAAASKNTEGQELTEMADLWQAGALAFGDGQKPLTNPAMVLRALQYASMFGAKLINRPDEPELSKHGQMHEGTQSVFLGMKGIPTLAETMALQRDLGLLAYAGGALHCANLSARESVELVRQAKKQGLAVTCDVAVSHLALTDEALAGFDTSYKTFPPFRTADDRLALWEGVADGTIDTIVSAHLPQDTESKDLEFDLAEPGLLALETFFSVLGAHRPDFVTLDLLIEKITTAPRKILGLPVPQLKVGAPACLTFFDPADTVHYQKEDFAARSRNTPWLNKTLQGLVKGIYNNQVFFSKFHSGHAV